MGGRSRLDGQEEKMRGPADMKDFVFFFCAEECHTRCRPWVQESQKKKGRQRKKETRVLGPLDNTVITRREGTLVQQYGDGSEKFRR